MSHATTSILSEAEIGQRQNPFAWTKTLVSNGASEWKISQRTLILMLSVPFMILFAGAASALISKGMYKWFIGEDKFAETMQVVFYVTAFLLNFVLVRRLWQIDQRMIALLYLIPMAGLVFLIGEELSWGQRIFGWVTPESLKAINKQDETNLHNIEGVGAAFKWIQLLVGAYGTFLPLLVLRKGLSERYKKIIAYLVPHYTLVPFFLMFFLWRVYRNLFEVSKRYYFVVSEFNEVLELILSVGIALFMIFQLRRMNRKTESAKLAADH